MRVCVHVCVTWALHRAVIFVHICTCVVSYAQAIFLKNMPVCVCTHEQHIVLLFFKFLSVTTPTSLPFSWVTSQAMVSALTLARPPS